MVDRYYHATCRSRLPSILSEGLKPGSYLAAHPSLADYYAETVEDDDGDPIILEIPAAALDEDLFAPDLPGISEPIMMIVREVHGLGRFVGEDWVIDRWAESSGDWRASLEIISSVSYAGPIPATVIKLEGRPLAG